MIRRITAAADCNGLVKLGPPANAWATRIQMIHDTQQHGTHFFKGGYDVALAKTALNTRFSSKKPNMIPRYPPSHGAYEIREKPRKAQMQSLKSARCTRS